jgi:Rho termination factor, N-terminal domain/TIR domain
MAEGRTLNVQIFISWSKRASNDLASALRNWLPEVIQRLEPWMSSEDISKGQRWGVEVAQRLDATSQGIVCVTRDNIREPWLNFEAGALAKSLQGSKVHPVLLGVATTEITGPIAQFQATIATDKEDMLQLVRSLNEACDKPLDEIQLERAFSRTWEEFLGDVVDIDRGVNQSKAKPKREVSDMVAEILERTREIQRSLISPSESLRPRRRVGTGLEAMVLPELKALASSLGINGTGGMRKSQLIAAIRAMQVNNQLERSSGEPS